MSARPRFSIVTAVHGAEAALPDFIAAIEAQDFDLSRVEVVAVVDGSPDHSLALLTAWQSRRPELVTVLTQENAGAGAARNRGMLTATGEWVTFADPEDTVDPGYLTAVDTWLRKHPSVGMAAANQVLPQDETGTLADKQSLRWHFANSGRLVDLRRRPRWFHGHAPTSFFRLDVLREQGLRFDDRVRPDFEDGHLFTRYMLALDEPSIVFVPAARYHRGPARRDPAAPLPGTEPARYTDAVRYGYLDVLRRAAERFGAVPEWVQNVVLYELSALFRFSERGAASVALAAPEVREEFLALLREVSRELDDEVVRTFSVVPFKGLWREALLAARGGDGHVGYAVLGQIDPAKRLVELRYLYHGDPPREELVVNGVPVPAAFGKRRAIRYFGATMLRERIVWVTAAGRLRVRLDGRAVPLRDDWPGRNEYEVNALGRWRKLVKKAPARDVPEEPRGTRVLRALATSRWARRWFCGAWVLIDRVPQANDSAETMFRFLMSDAGRAAFPDARPWFVVEKGTADWRRLRKSSRRVVAYGSLRWKVLMANARYLVSSHADKAITNPPDLAGLSNPDLRYVFLQHGVIKDDLSAWLNPKPISLFVTSTTPEFEYIVGDDSGYRYTEKEVVLTGLPRFDDLFRKQQRVAPQERDLLLVAPTWRKWLVPEVPKGEFRRRVNPDILESDFVREWMSFLGSDDLRQAAESSGLAVGLLLHPSFAEAARYLTVPEHVRLLDYDSGDVQMLFVRAAALVTDYSSVAFNFAFMNKPVVYFQFDRERMFSGAHIGTEGYYDYDRDGFGPVARDVDSAVKATVKAIEDGGVPEPLYADRMASTFRYRDDGASARVAAAIRALDT